MKITILPTPVDKQLHFWVGYAIMATTDSWLLLLAAAIGKEAYDYATKRRIDLLDIHYTVSGGFGGFMLPRIYFELLDMLGIFWIW